MFLVGWVCCWARGNIWAVLTCSPRDKVVDRCGTALIKRMTVGAGFGEVQLTRLSTASQAPTAHLADLLGVKGSLGPGGPRGAHRPVVPYPAHKMSCGSLFQCI